jgi:hypothetical protein
MRSWPLLPALACLAACTGPVNVPIAYCTSTRPVAVVVTVLDSVTGASVVDGAYGVVRDGFYVDSLRPSSPPPALRGGARLGTYQVIVDRPRYREWTRSDVVVSQQGSCGNPVPVPLTALLQPAP